MQSERAGQAGKSTSGASTEILSIDCQGCRVRPFACSDCVVSVLLGDSADQNFGSDELRALRVLADSGLVPPLRLQTGGSGKMVV
ncbi:MAG: hypothetical protein WCI74_17905 [Actinomycetes bacterium]